MVQAALALKDAELTERLAQQAEQHAQEMVALQHKLSQKSLEALAAKSEVASLKQQQQHELDSLRQQHDNEVWRLTRQLEEAAVKAQRAEKCTEHLRCAGMAEWATQWRRLTHIRM